MSANMAESSRPLHHYTDSVMTWQNVHTGDAVLYHDPGKASGDSEALLGHFCHQRFKFQDKTLLLVLQHVRLGT